MWKIVLFVIIKINYAVLDNFLLNNIVSEGTEFSSLVKCIIEISKSELYYKPTTLIENKDYINEEGNDFKVAVIKHLKINNIPQTVVDNKEEISNTVNKINATWLVVLYFDDCETFSHLDINIFKEHVKYLIIVYNFVLNDCREVAVQIGNKIMMYDVTFLVRNQKEYNIVTFIPEVEPDTCKVIVKKPTIINSCINGNLKLKTIFPIKTPRNFNKCAFKVGMSTLYPMSIIPNRDKMLTYDRITEIKGSDFEIIKIINKEFNSTLQLHFVVKTEESPFGQLDFIPFIVNGSLDVVAGGFYRIYGDIVEYSGIYARQAVFWFYTADREVRSWQNFVRKVDGLYIFIICYVIYTLIWYLVSKFDDQAISLTSTLLYSWGALLGASSLGDSKTIKQKILNLAYLIMCLHLSAYLSVQFYSFLTILNPPKFYTTNDDIMQSGRIAYLRSASKYFVNDQKYINFANTSLDCNDFWHCSVESLRKKGITVVLESYFTYFQANTTVDDEAKVLRVAENILLVYYEMLIRKGSPYVKRFQNLIQRLFETGIIEKLYKDGIGILIFDKAKIARENIISNSYSCGAGCQITLKQIAGAFYVWLIGCGFSFAIFVMEIINSN